MLCSAATKDCRLLDICNQSGVEENVFVNQFSTFDSPRDVAQRISSDKVQRNREAVPLQLQPKVKTNLTSEDGQKLWHNSTADVCVKIVDYKF